MATTQKTVQVVSNDAIATTTTQLSDKMPGIPCNNPAGITYTGARYVPLFATPLEWNKNTTYEPLTIVIHEGNSYTSRQFVPVGVDIANEDFWALTGNYNAQVEQYRQEVKTLTNNYYRTLHPVDFGAKGDGVTDDTEAVQNCFNECDGSLVDMQGLTYRVSSTITLPVCENALITNGCIKALSGFTGEYVVETSQNYTAYNNTGFALSVIDGVTIDAQHLGIGCIKLNRYIGITITNSYFLRFTTYGIFTAITESHELVLSNSYIRNNFRNETIDPDGIGIVLNTPDNIVTGCNFVCTGAYIIHNAQYNTITLCHLYGVSTAGKPSLIVNASRVFITDVYVDSSSVELNSLYFSVFKLNILCGRGSTYSPIIINTTGSAYYISSCHFEINANLIGGDKTIPLFKYNLFGLTEFNNNDAIIKVYGYLLNDRINNTPLNIGYFTADSVFGLNSNKQITTSTTDYTIKQCGTGAAITLNNPDSGNWVAIAVKNPKTFVKFTTGYSKHVDTYQLSSAKNTSEGTQTNFIANLPNGTTEVDLTNIADEYLIISTYGTRLFEIKIV